MVAPIPGSLHVPSPQRHLLDAVQMTSTDIVAIPRASLAIRCREQALGGSIRVLRWVEGLVDVWSTDISRDGRVRVGPPVRAERGHVELGIYHSGVRRRVGRLVRAPGRWKSKGWLLWHGGEQVEPQAGSVPRKISAARRQSMTRRES